VGLSAIRATAAGDGLNLLYLVADLLVKRGVGQKYKTVGAGMGVMVLASFAWTEYARLFGVHEGYLLLGLEVPDCFGRRRGLVFVCLYDIIRHLTGKARQMPVFVVQFA
jgi:hypothetical protein